MPPNDIKSFGSNMGVKNWKSSKLADIVVRITYKILHIVVVKFVPKPLTPPFRVWRDWLLHGKSNDTLFRRASLSLRITSPQPHCNNSNFFVIRKTFGLFVFIEEYDNFCK